MKTIAAAIALSFALLLPAQGWAASSQGRPTGKGSGPQVIAYIWNANGFRAVHAGRQRTDLPRADSFNSVTLPEGHLAAEARLPVKSAIQDLKSPEKPVSAEHVPTPGRGPGVEETLQAVDETLQAAGDIGKSSPGEARGAGERIQETLLGGGAPEDAPPQTPDSGEAPARQAQRLKRPTPIRGEDGASLIEDFARDYTPGKNWEPAGAPSPEAKDVYDGLQRLAGRINSAFSKMEEELALRKLLLSGLAHDIMNGLSMIGAPVQLLEMNEARTPKDRSRLHDMMKAAVRKLADITNNFLALGKMEAGRLAVKPAALDAAAIVKEATGRFQDRNSERKVSIVLSLPQAPVRVQGDPGALALVLANLVGNAVKYTPAPGRVTAGLHLDPAKPGRATFFVEDTGIGISEADQAKILQGFYRTEEGQKTAKGFGVGLMLVRRVLEASQTSLEIKSEPGKGSRFSFDLPLVPQSKP